MTQKKVHCGRVVKKKKKDIYIYVYFYMRKKKKERTAVLLKAKHCSLNSLTLKAENKK